VAARWRRPRPKVGDDGTRGTESTGGIALSRGRAGAGADVGAGTTPRVSPRGGLGLSLGKHSIKASPVAVSLQRRSPRSIAGSCESEGVDRRQPVATRRRQDHANGDPLDGLCSGASRAGEIHLRSDAIASERPSFVPRKAPVALSVGAESTAMRSALQAGLPLAGAGARLFSPVVPPAKAIGNARRIGLSDRAGAPAHEEMPQTEAAGERGTSIATNRGTENARPATGMDALDLMMKKSADHILG